MVSEKSIELTLEQKFGSLTELNVSGNSISFETESIMGLGYITGDILTSTIKYTIRNKKAGGFDKGYLYINFTTYGNQMDDNVYLIDLLKPNFKVLKEKLIGGDYILHDDTVIHGRNWNGEFYVEGMTRYYPVERYDRETNRFALIAFVKNV